MKRVSSTLYRPENAQKLILTIILIFLIVTRVPGQDVIKRNCTAIFSGNPPLIDGILSEEEWKKCEWITGFTQQEPFSGKSPTENTGFKLLFDDNNLYVAIRAYDSQPDSIVTRLTRRDQADGDLVAICLDSYHDLRTGFLFGVSSAGVKLDQVFFNDGQRQDPSWDPDWWVKTSCDENGWSAEMKIPLSQLRFEKNSGDVWGLQVVRVIFRKNETDFWQYIPRNAPGLIHMFGELKGLERIKPRKVFSLTPYFSGQAETFPSDNKNPFKSSGNSFSSGVGMDAKVGMTNNLTLDLTVNPDFGQVEADPSVVNLTAFETFFKEKRPFFIEGSNITSFSLSGGDEKEGNDNLFYSRRIGRAPQGRPVNMKNGWTSEMPSASKIINAAKLTGKTHNGWSVGFLNALTGEMQARIDTVGGRLHQPVEPLTDYFVGRVQKDINSGNTIIGGILTGVSRYMDSTLSSILHKTAFTCGIDFTRYFKNKSWMVSLNSALSMVNGTKNAILQTQQSSARYYQRPENSYVRYDPDRTSMSGTGGSAEARKLNGHWNFTGIFLWKSPGFETNDLGYISQADQLLAILGAGYNQWEPKGIYKRYTIGCDAYQLFNFGGMSLVRGIEPNMNLTLKNYWNTFISGSFSLKQLSTTLLRGGPGIKMPGSYNIQGGISTDNRKRIVFNLNGGTSGTYHNNSRSFFTNFMSQFRATDFLEISLSPQFNILHDQLQYQSQLAFGKDHRYIFATLTQKTLSVSFRINLNITPDLSLQYWGQPFVASGHYSEYKYITDPLAEKYNGRFHIYSGGQITGDGGSFLIDENEDGKSDYRIEAGDFNYKTFLSNLVIRWQFKPGSSLFLVWNQTRNGIDNLGSMDYFNDLGSLFRLRSTNVFLVKFSYRFGL